MIERVNPEWLHMLGLRAPAMRKARARDAGMDVDAYLENAERNVRCWVEGSPIRIRLGPESLASYLRTGRYEVMATTGASSGDLKTVETRHAVEEQILGIALNAPASSRPISGYLRGSDETGAVTRYGPIVLELGEHVRSRAWFLLGDLVDTPQLGGGQVLAPRPLLKPTIEAASGRYDVASAASLADACGPHRYAEVLIFDGLSPTDVVSVTYTERPPTQELGELVADAGWALKPPEQVV